MSWETACWEQNSWEAASWDNWLILVASPFINSTVITQLFIYNYLNDLLVNNIISEDFIQYFITEE